MNTFTLKNKKFIILIFIVVLSSTSNNMYTMQTQKFIDKQATKQLKKAKRTEYVYLSPAASMNLKSKAILHNVHVDQYMQNQKNKQHTTQYKSEHRTIIGCIKF